MELTEKLCNALEILSIDSGICKTCHKIKMSSCVCLYINMNTWAYIQNNNNLKKRRMWI